MGGECFKLAWTSSPCRLWHRTTAECGIPSRVTTFSNKTEPLTQISDPLLKIVVPLLQIATDRQMQVTNLQVDWDYAACDGDVSQRAAQLSLHDAPIFRLLLKIAVF